MNNHNTETYQAKRETLNFSRRISYGTEKDIRKHAADMIYGVLASGGCVLSRIADTLHEDILKKNTIERLSLKLAQGVPEILKKNYHQTMLKMIPHNTVVHVDESEVI